MEHKVSLISDRNYWSVDDVRRVVESSPVVVFAKGDQSKPGCGFSEEAFHAIEDCHRPYQVIDVTRDNSIMPALRTFAGNAFLPLIFVDGALVSNSESLRDVKASGTLRNKIEKAFWRKH